MAEKNYAREWYEYGRKHDDDPIVKFMLHWVAFNWLYSAYYYRRQDEPTKDFDRRNIENRYSEREKIKKFCKAKYDRLSQFDAFHQKEFSVFKEGKVVSETPPYNGYNGKDDPGKIFDILKDEEKDEEERIEKLFLTIYQVRCNLFHGSKSLMNPRDIDLVRASSVLLEGYLEKVI